MRDFVELKTQGVPSSDLIVLNGDYNIDAKIKEIAEKPEDNNVLTIPGASKEFTDKMYNIYDTMMETLEGYDVLTDLIAVDFKGQMRPTTSNDYEIKNGTRVGVQTNLNPVDIKKVLRSMTKADPYE